MVAQRGHLSIVLDLSITDHAGIAATYGRRIHQLIQKTALKRSPNTDYFALLSAPNSDVKAAAIRDFDALSEAIKKEKEKSNLDAVREKAKKSKDRNKKWGKKKEENTNENG